MNAGSIYRLRKAALLGVTAGLLLGAAGAPGQMRAAEKPPHIGYVFPAGGRPGTTVTVKIGGEHVYGATAAVISGKNADVRVLDARDPYEGQEFRKKNKKKNQSVIDEIVMLQVTLAPDAEPGDRDICLVTPQGASNKLVFQIGSMPETQEVEPNDQLAKALPLPPLPVLVNGRIMPGDVDAFKFFARQGQRLVADTAARALLPYIADGVPGWFQALVTLYNARGQVVACADHYRFNQDPVLFYDVPADGEYTLTIRDSIYRGREDFVYRLRIGELPFITGISPLGAPRGEKPVTVKLLGRNLPTDTVAVAVDQAAPARQQISVINHGLISSRVPFAVDELPERTVGPEAAQPGGVLPVAWPVIVNGCLRQPGEKQAFSFAGRQGQLVSLEVLARRLGSPLDSGLVLADSRGRKIAENDDAPDRGEGFLTHQADSAILCRLPEDGTYTVTIYDTQGQGGADYAYRLRISPPIPDFELRATPAAVRVAPGGSALLTVYAIRRDGFDGPIRLALDAPSAGLTLDGAVIPDGADQVRLTVSAARNAAATRCAVCLRGTALIAGKTITRPAVPAEDLMQAFLYQHLMPFHEETLLVTGPAAPFGAAVQLPPAGYLELPRGKESSFPVAAIRTPGYDGPIRIQLVNPPKGITVRQGFIRAGQNTGWVTVRTESKVGLAVTTNAPPGQAAGTPRVARASALRENLIFTGMMPVEREATPEERARLEAQAAKKAGAAPAGSPPPGATAQSAVFAKARPQKNAAAAGPDVPGPAVKKPVMITRPVAVMLPAVPFRVVDQPGSQHPLPK
ncbi:MAG: PPC domain-containing protein [Kiritimatiellaeota bacterium]|nr:PPC domain-containing protein [Kiritimatiellota bacterium]